MNQVSVSIKHPAAHAGATENSHATEFGVELGKEPTAKIALKPGIVITGHVTDEAGKPIAAHVCSRAAVNPSRIKRAPTT